MVKVFLPSFSWKQARRSRRVEALTSGVGSPVGIESLECRAMLSSAAVDTSFATDGVLNLLGGSPTDFAIQGGTDTIVATALGDGDFRLERIDANGVVDATFGLLGSVDVDFLNQSIDDPHVLLDAAGNILLVGGGNAVVGLASLTADGVVDLTFGTAGRLEVPLAQGEKLADAVLDDAGNILLLIEGAAGQGRVVKVDADGAVDVTFGNGGSAPVNQITDVDNIRVDTNGRVIVTGSDGDDVQVVRLNADGSVDVNFGNGGLKTIHIGDGNILPDDVLNAFVEIDPQGRLVIAAGVNRNNPLLDGVNTVNFIRLNDDGSLDTAFGVGGLVTISVVQGAQLQDLEIDDESHILIAVSQPRIIGLDSDAAVLRFNVDGSPDAEFGNEGVFVLPAFGLNISTHPIGIHLLDNGNLMVGTNEGGLLGTNLITRLLIGPPAMHDVITIDSANGDVLVGISNGTQFNFKVVGNLDQTVNWQYRLGDFDGDGLRDLLAIDELGFFHVGLNRGDTFDFSVWGRWNRPAFTAIVNGDFNGDGKTDVAGLHTGNRWWVQLSQGDGFVLQPFSTFSSTGWVAHRAGDYNGDGRTDIASVHQSGDVWVSQANDAGTRFESRVLFRIAPVATAGWGSFVQGDFNGDGKTDLAFRAATGQFWTAISDNFGGPSRLLYAGRLGPANWMFFDASDLNGDGLADIIGRLATGDWWSLQSYGTGFNLLYFGKSSLPPNTGFAVADANVDGDAITDSVFLDRDTGNFLVGRVVQGRIQVTIFGQTGRDSLGFFAVSEFG